MSKRIEKLEAKIAADAERLRMSKMKMDPMGGAVLRALRILDECKSPPMEIVNALDQLQEYIDGWKA